MPAMSEINGPSVDADAADEEQDHAGEVHRAHGGGQELADEFSTSDDQPVDHRVTARGGGRLGRREDAAVQPAQDDHRHAERRQRALRLAQRPGSVELAAARELEP